jgi:dTDP-4-amino-4,6-dideoxygalactose transaminase
MTFQPSPSRAPLAILGSVPAFREVLHVGRPNIGDRSAFLQRINEMFDRRWLTNAGPLVLEFERKLAEFLQVKHVLAMCNATVALELAIRAADLTGEVIVPSYTFIATAHALQWQQVTPVFADINPSTHCLDPVAVERMITPRTTGIIGVHVWGTPCVPERLAELAAKHNLKLIFDAAHAFGCSHNGRMIGGFGLAEVFSFHATKFFNTFEGGAVATNDDAFAEKLRLMRNFGFAGFDNVVYIGTNGKMAEASAAMGLTNLESLELFVETNRSHYRRYSEALKAIPGLRLFPYNERERCNFQYVVVEVDAASAVLSRDEYVAVLHAENVLARKYFWPGCHQMQPYRSLFPHARLLLPHTEDVSNRVFLLPTGTAMSAADVDRVCMVLATATAHAREVRSSLSRR